MALQFGDRVEQMTSTTGLGNLTLTTTPTARQRFQDAITTGNTVLYCIEDGNGTGWEVGTGTFTSPSTLSRDTISASSTGVKITLSSNEHRVFICPNAEYLTDVVSIASGHVGVGGASNHPDATGSVSGFMSASDYTKLSNIPPATYAALTDPASSSINTSMVDNYGGVVITVTTTSNSQTISSPTNTSANRSFTVVNKASSTEPVVINGSPIIQGSKLIFVWDGAAWVNGNDLLLKSLTDPAASGITQDIVDKYSGVIITSTVSGDALTIASPSVTTSGRSFTVLSSSSSTDVILVDGNPIQPGESVAFTWSGSAWQSDPIAVQMKSLLGSGRQSGLEISATLGATTFNIAAGVYYVVDNYTHPDRPFPRQINYAGSTGNTLTNIATSLITIIGLDVNGDVVEYANVPPDPSIDRDVVIIGSVGHSNLTNITSYTSSFRVPTYDIGPCLHDLFQTIGPLVSNDSDFAIGAASTDLTISRASGREVFWGNNNDRADPNRLFVAADASVANFFAFFRDGAGGFNVDVTNPAVTAGLYDDGAVTTTAPVGAVTTNRWVNHRFFYSAGADAVIMQYGQNTYASKENALAAINTETFEKNPALNLVPFRTFLTMRGGATDLSDLGDAQFTTVGKFSATTSGGTSSTTSLQDAYDNSVTPEILTNSTLGALSIKRGSAADTDTVLEVLNGAGDVTLSVMGDGSMLSEVDNATPWTATRFGTGTNDQKTVIALKYQTTASAIDGFGPRLTFQMQDSGGVAGGIGRILATRDGAYNTGALSLQSGLNGAITGVYIDKNQSVGIGTSNTAPVATLDVAGDGYFKKPAGGSNYIKIDTASASDTGFWISENGTNRFRIENAAAANYLAFYNYGASKNSVVIDYSSNVGINNNAPAHSLDVTGNIAASGVVGIGSYLVSTLPTASAYTGFWAYATDEITGAQPVFSNGTNWLTLALTTASDV